MKNEDLKFALSKIWEHYLQLKLFKSKELNSVLKRKFCFAEPEHTGKILVVGFNPSYKQGNDEVITYTLPTAVHPYFTTIRKTISDRGESTYLDLFFFKYTVQAAIQKLISNEGEAGLSFMAEQLKLSQRIIEDSNPELILVLNKGAWAYWGVNPKYVWMGYIFEEVNDIELNEGKLMRITGLQDSHLRVSPEITETNLVGKMVYFSRHLNRVPSDKRKKITNEIDAIKKKYGF